MSLGDLKVCALAMELGESVWKLVDKWSYFHKDTIGKQLVRAADSIAANLSEGYGRYYFKENKNFSYYARGSLYETKAWLIKAHSRGLLEDNEFNKLIASIDIFARMLNTYIKSIGNVGEPFEEYGESEANDN